LPISDEHNHYKLLRCSEHEVDFGLPLFPNNGRNDSLRNTTKKRDDDVEKPDERSSEDIGIKMDFSDDLLHLVCCTILFVIDFLYVNRKLGSEY
jgi:hypothetical protein